MAGTVARNVVAKPGHISTVNQDLRSHFRLPPGDGYPVIPPELQFPKFSTENIMPTIERSHLRILNYLFTKDEAAA